MGGEKGRRVRSRNAIAGSPPRGRGKVRGATSGPPAPRITPAWAGKSISQTSTMKPARDHPRVGGEKSLDKASYALNKGSPPRGRGKENPHRVTSPVGGITPAWAGKSQLTTLRTWSPRDHPRVGGEKLPPNIKQPWIPGSPPRGRGKAVLREIIEDHTGITPAWAGKSPETGQTLLADEDHPRVGGEKHSKAKQTGKTWDHPRVGGEKFLALISAIACLGSPPRGRGKVDGCSDSELDPGITPAWAGKSQQWPHMCGRSWDHPRVGGEKFVGIENSTAGIGSPPRGRGKGGSCSTGKSWRRITPAWAGKSLKQYVLTAARMDHPRVGGEKIRTSP